MSGPIITRYTSMDAVRGIAALIVVFRHFYGALPGSIKDYIIWLQKPPLMFLINGRAAVVVFFVLSGFVLALPYIREHGLSYRDFILRRLCRIYIPFAVTVLLCALAFWAVDGSLVTQADGIAWTWKNQKLSAGIIGGHLLMTGIKEHVFLNSPMWSLVHEMRVSLLFPWLALFIKNIQKNLFLAIGFLVSVVILTKLSLASFEEFPFTVERFYLTALVTFYFIPAFALGILLAQHQNSILNFFKNLNRRKRLCLWTASLGFFSIVGQLGASFVIALDTFVLLALILSSEKAGRLLNAQPLQWLGRVSYSLYLIHTPVLLTAIHLGQGHIPPLYSIILAFPVTLAASELMCRFVELPSIRLGKYLTRPQRAQDSGV